MAVIHPRGRPHDPFARTRDAVALFNALKRRGYTWDRARELVNIVTGVSERNIERYAADRSLTPPDAQTADTLARIAIAKNEGWAVALEGAWDSRPDLYRPAADLMNSPTSWEPTPESGDLLPGA